MITKEQFAERLNGREYRSEITKEEEVEAASSGLVVVYGASDDLVEFAGSISDEMGEGSELQFNKKGDFLPYMEDDIEEFIKDNDLMDLVLSRYPNKLTGNYDGVWRFSTDIPHAKFTVFEDGEEATIGIVFNITDLK